MQSSCLFSLFQSVQVPWMFLNFLTLKVLKITGHLFYTTILNLSLVVLFSSWLNLSCITRRNITVNTVFSLFHTCDTWFWCVPLLMITWIKWYLPAFSNIKLLISHLRLRNILRRDNLNLEISYNSSNFQVFVDFSIYIFQMILMVSYFIHWLIIFTILYILMLELSQFWPIEASSDWFVNLLTWFHQSLIISWEDF